MTNSMFQKRHYSMIATVFKMSRPHVLDRGGVYVWETLVENFSAVFAGDNDRFNCDRFYEACGYPLDPR